MQWRSELYDHEESPPPDAWVAIQEALAEDAPQLRQQLLAHEAEPPPEAWAQIAASLKEDAA